MIRFVFDATRLLLLLAIMGVSVWVLVPLGLLVWPVVFAVHLTLNWKPDGLLSPIDSVGVVVHSWLYLWSSILRTHELIQLEKPGLTKTAFTWKDLADLSV